MWRGQCVYHKGTAVSSLGETGPRKDFTEELIPDLSLEDKQASTRRESAFQGEGQCGGRSGLWTPGAPSTCLLLPSSPWSSGKAQPPQPGIWTWSTPSAVRGHCHIALFYSVLRMHVVFWCVSGLVPVSLFTWLHAVPLPCQLVHLMREGTSSGMFMPRALWIFMPRAVWIFMPRAVWPNGQSLEILTKWLNKHLLKAYCEPSTGDTAPASDLQEEQGS